jgi:alginate O-acetyltransferase complex protein AlgI
LQAILTFGLVLISWVFFRAATLADSFRVIGQMFTGAPGTVLLNTWQFGLVAVALLLAVAEEKWEWFDRVSIGPAWAYAAGLTSMLLCLELFGVTDVSIPFVYFQF